MRTGKLDGQGVAAMLELLAEPTPATYIRQVLGLYRQRGWEFEQAWAQAMRTLPRYLPDIDAWRASLHSAKPAFKRAYDTPSREPIAA